VESQGVTHVGGRRIDHGGVGGRRGSAAATPLDSTVVVHGNNVLADLGDEFSNDGPTAAKSTRELVQDARIFGLAGVVKGTPVTVIEQLSAGTYYLFDANSVAPGAKPTLTTLQVSGPGGSQGGPIFPFPGISPLPIHLPFPLIGPISGIGAFPIHLLFPLRGLPSHSGVFPGHATVKLTSDDRFDSPDVLPAAGTITVRNVSDTIHFMEESPVKPGTTDKDIQDFFDSGTQSAPPFAQPGPQIEMGVLSPGKHADITYNLPAGTYVLLCFVADDQSGIPHALMGMHKVVTLK
jgi:hypothetical protein